MHGDFSLSKCAVNLDVYGLKELTLLEKKSDKGYEYHLEENQWVAGKIIEECEGKGASTKCVCTWAPPDQ